MENVLSSTENVFEYVGDCERFSFLIRGGSLKRTTIFALPTLGMIVVAILQKKDIVKLN